jgi:hypothetical protein
VESNDEGDVEEDVFVTAHEQAPDMVDGIPDTQTLRHQLDSEALSAE